MPENLQHNIEDLRQRILYVGSLVEEAVAKAIGALRGRDEQIAREVIQADSEIDHMEIEVEEDCLRILALYQPVALDLRFVVAVLKINNDLERIGDLAKNIAKRVVCLARAQQLDIPIEYEGMAEIAQAMVKNSLDALVTGDAALARQVRLADDEVDSLRDTIHGKIQAEISAHPEETELLMKLFSVARHLERLADMATHIAEEVIYMVEGHIVRHRASA
jgi:phosphate transport system protein